MARRARGFGLLPKATGWLRQLIRSGFSAAEAVNELNDAGINLPEATLRVAARKAALGVRAAENLMSQDWRKTLSWKKILGVKNVPEYISVHVKIRKLDTGLGGGDWVSGVVVLKTPSRAGDLVRSLHEQISDEARERGSPTGELGEVRRDRLRNISIEVIDPQ